MIPAIEDSSPPIAGNSNRAVFIDQDNAPAPKPNGQAFIFTVTGATE